jgi:hypothetical protein
MSWYQVICVIGVPGLIGGLWAYIFARLKMLRSELQAIKLGTQAVLRNSLIELYEIYYHQGFAPIYVKDNYDNLYKQYHALGANGVMDSYYNQFMALPTERSE